MLSRRGAVVMVTKIGRNSLTPRLILVSDADDHTEAALPVEWTAVTIR